MGEDDISVAAGRRAIIQFLGGPQRQLGVLLATGLLIPNPLAGWAVLAGIAIRLAVLRLSGGAASGHLQVLAAGIIAGRTRRLTGQGPPPSATGALSSWHAG